MGHASFCYNLSVCIRIASRRATHKSPYHTQKLYNKRDFKACAERRSAAYLAYVSIPSRRATQKSPYHTQKVV